MEDNDGIALAAHASLEPQPAEEVNSPEDFLARLSEALKASDGVDADIASILADHLLTATPHANAVANAKAAIAALAENRANPAKEQTDG